MAASHTKKLAKVRVAGPDHKGIIATVTMHLFKNGLNIEDIDQRILEGYLVMNMVVDLKDAKSSVAVLRESLKAVGRKIGMDITLTPEAERKVKHVALLVTREPHCLQTLLKDMKSGTIRGRPVVVLANRPDLEGLAKKYGAPFFCYPADKKKDHERFVLDKLAEYDVDLIVLARYMQILSPEFCFRYEGKIINIHPSLLPSFPGARPYSQAYDKGVEVVGVTAHFVTTDLDQGPIICQDAFRVDKHKHTLEEIVARGKAIEAKTLARAVKLYCDGRLALRRGKVIDSRRLHQFEEKLKEFYGS
ncbi:MAG TPA: formyltetrahydrofolate deformylase [bacterium]|nr:formyltetrahydrofolate deformylase [bacterium]